jgi:hypothetical protein
LHLVGWFIGKVWWCMDLQILKTAICIFFLFFVTVTTWYLYILLTFKQPMLVYANTHKNTPRYPLNIVRQKEIYWIFKECCILFFYFSQNALYFIILSFSVHIIDFCINCVVKFKYQSDCLKVNILVAVMLTIERIFNHQSQQGHYLRHFTVYASHMIKRPWQLLCWGQITIHSAFEYFFHFHNCVYLS